MSEPRDGSQGGGPGDPRRPSGPLESLFQEAVRRATGLGISGLASTEEAVRKAQAVIAAFAEQPGAGTVGIGGVMYDRPHLERARQLVARAKAARGAGS